MQSVGLSVDAGAEANVLVDSRVFKMRQAGGNPKPKTPSKQHQQHQQQQLKNGATENCDPNFSGGRASKVRAGGENCVTPAKASRQLFAASPRQERASSPGAHDSVSCDSPAVPRSSSKAPKEQSCGSTHTPGRKHICRSARCAANDPDYAVPAAVQPRKFLLSKRHLLHQQLEESLNRPRSTPGKGRALQGNENENEHVSAGSLSREAGAEDEGGVCVAAEGDGVLHVYVSASRTPSCDEGVGCVEMSAVGGESGSGCEVEPVEEGGDVAQDVARNCDVGMCPRDLEGAPDSARSCDVGMCPGDLEVAQDGARSCDVEMCPGDLEVAQDGARSCDVGMFPGDMEVEMEPAAIADTEEEHAAVDGEVLEIVQEAEVADMERRCNKELVWELPGSSFEGDGADVPASEVEVDWEPPRSSFEGDGADVPASDVVEGFGLLRAMWTAKKAPSPSESWISVGRFAETQDDFDFEQDLLPDVTGRPSLVGNYLTGRIWGRTRRTSGCFMPDNEDHTLKRQEPSRRKLSSEWRIDDAMIKELADSDPNAEGRVRTLVEAFEKVISLAECEPQLPRHARRTFSFRPRSGEEEPGVSDSQKTVASSSTDWVDVDVMAVDMQGEEREAMSVGRQSEEREERGPTDSNIGRGAYVRSSELDAIYREFAASMETVYQQEPKPDEPEDGDNSRQLHESENLTEGPTGENFTGRVGDCDSFQEASAEESPVKGEENEQTDTNEDNAWTGKLESQDEAENADVVDIFSADHEELPTNVDEELQEECHVPYGFNEEEEEETCTRGQTSESPEGVQRNDQVPSRTVDDETPKKKQEEREACVSLSADSDAVNRTRNKKRRDNITIGQASPSLSPSSAQQRRVKACVPQPFKLQTEERGAIHEMEFIRKVGQMIAEEARLRIPIARGLPWTTDEPEVVPKPPVKEGTKPVEFRLNSTVRALDRAEFDKYVADAQHSYELQRREEDRLRQISEEEEVKRLRQEMVPKAQLMPYFDHPFQPRRSSKRLTVPKEPSFHSPQKRAKCIAWNHGLWENGLT